VNQHVPEARQTLELAHEVGWEPGVGRQAADSARVVLEALAPPSRQLPGDIDDELADGQQREEHVVVQGQVAP
jgi:hypothetical protein